MSEVAAAQPNIVKYRFSKSLIGRFTFKQTMRGASIWALIIGAYVASKSIGFAKVYPTQHARDKFAASLGNNIGLSAIFGKPHDVSTVTGYTEWNAIGVVVIILAIWSLLMATKTMRGAEESGRWETLLAGQTSGRRAAFSAIAGMSASIVLLYAIVSICFIAVGHNKQVNYSASTALLFSLTVTSAAAVFMSVGALTSQLMPTRSRSTMAATMAFGIFFILRAMADITSLGWLDYITPFGWIEKIQPLSGPKPLWLLPIAAFVLIVCSFAIYLAGERDLGESLFADKASVKPKFGLLNSNFAATIRLSGTNSLSWLSAISFTSIFYGLLTKSAAQSLSQSVSASRTFNKLSHSSTANFTLAFLGVVFMIAMLVMMNYAASAIVRIRQEEADGYLDNLLVQPLRRLTWLGDRCFVALVTIIMLGLTAAIATWVGVNLQHGNVSLHTLIVAGINSLPPAIFILGFGVFCIGFIPRLSSVLSYALVGWSFLVLMLSSGLHLSHWLLDTSLLYHMSLAPAKGPNWQTDAIMTLIGLALYLIGALRFNNRDLANE